MTRARARWVAAQVIRQLNDAGGSVSQPMIDSGVALMVRRSEAEQPVRPQDVRRLGVVLQEARRLSATLHPAGNGVHELLDVLGKAENEMEALGTAAALMADNDG